jgi:hypothetical protein
MDWLIAAMRICRCIDRIVCTGKARIAAWIHSVGCSSQTRRSVGKRCDLTDASPAVLRVERNRVATEGLGAEILVYQQPDGGWRRDNAPVWVTTLFTLQLLRATGVDRANPVVDAAAARLEAGLRWNDQGGWWELRPVETGGNTLFEGEVEPCINGVVLAIGSYFGRPVGMLANRLVADQLEDGGWELRGTEE